MPNCDYCGGVSRYRCSLCGAFICHLHTKEIDGKKACIRCYNEWKAKHGE